MTTPLLRLERCRHPSASLVLRYWSLSVCRRCGSYRLAVSDGFAVKGWGPWTRPQLVSDLIAEKKGSGK